MKTMPQAYEKRAVPLHESRACNCIGPQDGQPPCPCRMRNVKVVDGRYVQVIDHGPAIDAALNADGEKK